MPWVDPSRERRSRSVYIGVSQRNGEHMIRITKFILDNGGVQLHPKLRQEMGIPGVDTAKDPKAVAKNKEYYLRNCDEMWVFGQLNDSVFEELKIAKSLGKAIRYFTITPNRDFKEVPKEGVGFEKPVIGPSA